MDFFLFFKIFLLLLLSFYCFNVVSCRVMPTIYLFVMYDVCICDTICYNHSFYNLNDAYLLTEKYHRNSHKNETIFTNI